MKNKLKILAPFLLIALAVVLLAGGTVGNVRAALTYYSDNYDLDIEVPSIGVTLTENGRNAATRTPSWSRIRSSSSWAPARDGTWTKPRPPRRGRCCIIRYPWLRTSGLRICRKRS